MTNTPVLFIWEFPPPPPRERKPRFLNLFLVTDISLKLILFLTSHLLTFYATVLFSDLTVSMNLTNRMWFNVVCTLINNDTRHHSGQSVVDSRGVASWVHNKFWPPWWRVSLSIRVQITLNHIRFVFYRNIKVKENVFLECELKRELRVTLTRAALSILLSTTAN